MAVKIFPLEKQIKGGFNNGEIVENKPVQSSPDRSKLQPYSTIFYWAHAWANKTSTIGLHPHKAFEIMSFVLKGEIEHYDTKNQTWMPLHAGDVQIIRAGNGISHAEKLIEGSHIFQIWFDPNIASSLNQPASYNDYRSGDFPVTEKNGFTITTFKGENAPVEMQTPGTTIQMIKFKPGAHLLNLDSADIHSLYLIEGDIKFENNMLHTDDFLLISGESNFDFSSEGGGELFMITSLALVPYVTYASGSA
ncbi:MAG: pirin family protein [Chitinophagales bacterium]